MDEEDKWVKGLPGRNKLRVMGLVGGGDIRVDQSAKAATLAPAQIKNISNCHESCITTQILMHNENKTKKNIKVALNTTYEDTISLLVRTIWFCSVKKILSLGNYS